MTAFLKLLLIGLLAACATAVRVGDEAYADQPLGSFWVFANQTVHVINPSNQTVLKNITSYKGAALSALGALGGSTNKSLTWNDLIFATDGGDQWIFVTTGDLYPGQPAAGSSANNHSYVMILDANQQEVVSRVAVGPNPVHIYSVSPARETWSHSDLLGTFDVISWDDIGQSVINTTVVPAFFDKPGHGKLLIDDYLYPKGYATNVNGNNHVFAVDIEARARVATFNFTGAAASCIGTHSVVYSNISEHAYFECISGGTIEWDVVTDEQVNFFPDVSGYLTAAPGDDYIFVSDSDTNQAHILLPQGNRIASVVLYNVNVPGVPQHPIFWSATTDDYGAPAGNYTIFWPLADDTNLANLASAARLGADVTSSRYAAAPADCVYANSSNSAGGLQLATNANNAVSTPSCGSCAAGFNPFNPSAFNASAAGFRYANLSSIANAALRNRNASTTFLAAGAVTPVIGAASTSNQCSFGETYRVAKRGGKWVATPATIPSASLQLVDASAPGGPSLVGSVLTAASPSLVTWVPTTTTVAERESLGNLAVPGLATQAPMPETSQVFTSG